MDKIKNTYNTIDKVINKGRIMMYVALILNAIVSLTLGVLIYLNSQNILVIDKDGDIVSAFKAKEEDYQIIEADNHVRLFYDRFFTYTRDNYREKIDLGLLICGQSGKRLYETFQKKGWFDMVINDDLSIESFVKTIELERINSKEIRFYAKGIQIVKKNDLQETRHLDIKGTIIGSQRIKIKNPHGLKITDIVILNNDTIIEDE